MVAALTQPPSSLSPRPCPVPLFLASMCVCLRPPPAPLPLFTCRILPSMHCPIHGSAGLAGSSSNESFSFHHAAFLHPVVPLYSALQGPGRKCHCTCVHLCTCTGFIYKQRNQDQEAQRLAQGCHITSGKQRIKTQNLQTPSLKFSLPG